MHRFFLIIFSLFITFFATSQRKANTWQSYLSYANGKKVAIGTDKVFCATEGGLFYQDLEDNSVKKFENLSDFGIQTIAYNDDKEMLIVAYENSNIDLITNNGYVLNLPYIKTKQFSRDKTINNIYTTGNYAHLACSFGVVVLNLEKNEIKDTYYITDNTSITIHDVALYDDYLYVATAAGLYRANTQQSNLLDFNSWQVVNELPLSNYTLVEKHGDQLIASQENSSSNSKIHSFNNNNWNVLRASYPDLQDLHSENGLLVISGKKKVAVLNQNNQEIAQVSDYYQINNVKKQLNVRNAMVDHNNTLWIADFDNGLIKLSDNQFESIYPGGPISNDVFHINTNDGNLLIAPGGRTDAWNNTFTQPFFLQRQNGEWSVFDQSQYPEMNGFWDIVETAIDPNNANHIFAASWGGGLLEFLDGQLVERYNNHNSPLQSALPNQPNEPFVRIGGLAFDNQNNLWMTVSGVENKVVKRTPAGEWSTFQLPKLSTDKNVGKILITEHGDKWIIAPRGQNAYVLNKDAEQSKKLIVRTYFNNGKVEKYNTMSDLYSMAEDLDGHIWIGSSKGVAVYNNPRDVWDDNFYAYEPSLDLGDNLYHPILTNETVTAIAVDGANQKWLGTNNSGVFLLSEDGTEEILHFDTDNSPLFSNRIMDISIDDKTGEVFIGTSKGLISYQGDAIAGKEVYDNVYAYPNPVREDYRGNITITGLVANSDVKITDIAGNLVYHTTSKGGNAIWNGKNLNGNRVHTGVYLVFCNDEQGEESCITKILFIH